MQVLDLGTWNPTPSEAFHVDVKPEAITHEISVLLDFFQGALNIEPSGLPCP